MPKNGRYMKKPSDFEILKRRSQLDKLRQQEDTARNAYMTLMRQHPDNEIKLTVHLEEPETHTLKVSDVVEIYLSHLKKLERDVEIAEQWFDYYRLPTKGDELV